MNKIFDRMIYKLFYFVAAAIPSRQTRTTG